MRELRYRYAVAQAAYPGLPLEQAGDRYVVEPFENSLLIAAIDGLGHGEKAAQAAITAAAALRQHADKSPAWLLDYCNRVLQGTRGAAVSVVTVDLVRQQLEWAGVGNVAGILLRPAAEGKKSESLLTRGGVIGFRMPRIHSVCLDLSPGDTLILTSDGIRSGYMETAPLHEAPQELADQILEQSKRETDDALVLVLRLLPA